VPQLDEERYVRELFESRFGVQLRKVPESAEKTFDFELLSEGRRLAAVEVKRLGRAPRTEENGWKSSPGTGFVSRPDNSASRVGDTIHKAVKQLATSADPKVLVLVNDDSMDLLDLHNALKGYLLYGTEETGYFKNNVGMKVARGRIRDEKLQIDLYIWINRYEGRIPHRIDGLPLEPHAEPNRPFFVFVSYAGYDLARSRFGVPEAQRPDVDPDAAVPTLRELLLRQALGKSS
jgi:hypothetical protein